MTDAEIRALSSTLTFLSARLADIRADTQAIRALVETAETRNTAFLYRIEALLTTRLRSPGRLRDEAARLRRENTELKREVRQVHKLLEKDL